MLTSPGCLIVEIHDHRSTPSTAADRPNDKSDKTDEKAFSIHKSTSWVTPSPYRDHIPYPSPVSTPQNSPPSTSEQQAGSRNSDNARPPEKIFTCVLHPTQLSHYHDVLIEATSVMPDSRNPSKKAQAAKEGSTPLSAYPPTPSSSVAPTPVMSKGQPAKKQRMKIDDFNVHHFEAELLKRQEPTLFLDPAQDFADVRDILEFLKHPLHDHEPPKHNGRKRTHAELEADEAAAAEEERIALICDPRFTTSLGNAGTGAAGPGEGHDATNAVDMTFNRFKRIEDIHTRHKEEQHARAMDEGKREQMKKEHEMQQREAMMQKARQQKSNEEQMMKLRAENAAAASQNQTPQLRNSALMQQQSLQNLRMQQSGAPHSSPLMAPSGMGSSPINQHPMQRGGGVPMSTNMSQNDFNSPRPGSAMNMQPNMTQPMARQPSLQHSNASHSRTVTPQLPNMTPQMGQNIPLQQTPQMQNHHGSPVHMQNGHGPVMPPNLNNAQQVALIQQQQQALRQRQQREQQMRLAQNSAQMQQAQNGGMHMSPQQQHAAMQARYLQQQQQQSHAMQTGNVPTANGQSIGRDEYQRRLAMQMKAQQPPQAHQVQNAQAQAQQVQAHQNQQNMSNMTPVAPGIQFNPNMLNSNNMVRHPSHQQFPQQSGMHTPHMPQGSPPQHQMPQQHQPTANQMSSHVRQFQETFNQSLQNTRPEWEARLAGTTGGRLPPDVEERWSQYKRHRMTAAVYKQFPNMMRRPQGQTMQGLDHNQGQNMSGTPNMNMMMRQHPGPGQQPNQNHNFNPQMSPHGNMGMQNMQGHMQNNMPGHMHNNMQAMQGMTPQQLHHLKIEKMKQQQQQQQQQAMAAHAASGGMSVNGHMQQRGPLHGQIGLPGPGQGPGRGGG